MISCLLSRINEVINEKMVNKSAILNTKRLDMTLLLESYHISFGIKALGSRSDICFL